ncbi:MAG TPA: hypothetical protein VFQ53_08870 [Kofleriaceae bacterium]|nr:hypothetical protein [Kofleriaceae bacterium]
MATLSTSAWIAHEVGLATALGGTLFGRQAFQPAIREIDDDQTRYQVSDAAWRRFSWVNLAAHGVVAATWFVGRSMLSGREVSGTARTLTRVKDALVIASLATGITSVIAGRILGKRTTEQGARATKAERENADRLRRVVGTLGLANLASNIGIGAVTAVLAMEGNKSGRFSVRSRWLP